MFSISHQDKHETETDMCPTTRIALAVLVLIAVAGCGNGNKPVYPVSGQITLDGKPMEGGGSISLIPMEKMDGKTAGGIIDEDGNYTLSTHDQNDGSMAGKFKVVITQSAVEEPEPTEDGQPRKEAVNVVSPDKLIPLTYSDPATTPLTTTVEEQTNELNFDLKKEAGQPAPQQFGA